MFAPEVALRFLTADTLLLERLGAFDLAFEAIRSSDPISYRTELYTVFSSIPLIATSGLKKAFYAHRLDSALANNVDGSMRQIRYEFPSHAERAEGVLGISSDLLYVRGN